MSPISQLSQLCQFGTLQFMGADENLSVRLRIIDANLNRASEGLRVVEETLRLAVEDPHLTQLCKLLRHELAGVLKCCPLEQLHAARDTLNDVGTEIGLPDEYARQDTCALLTANLKRVQQSLRCLEEYVKTIEAAAARNLEQLRYRAYSLEKAITSTIVGSQRLADCQLYVLVDGRDSADQFEALVDALVSAGVHVIQLRDKTLDDRELLQRAHTLREMTRPSDSAATPRTLFIMNDRPDIALLSAADGVHVGQNELRVRDVRRIVGTTMLVGVSTHSRQQARQAVLEGANYIGVGPTFPSQTKQFESFPGLELLRHVSDEITLPAFAIGGITLDKLADVLSAGCRRVAVSRAIVDALDPAESAREMLQRLAALSRLDRVDASQ